MYQRNARRRPKASRWYVYAQDRWDDMSGAKTFQLIPHDNVTLEVQRNIVPRMTLFFGAAFTSVCMGHRLSESVSAGDQQIHFR